jgi:hypothetical protein
MRRRNDMPLRMVYQILAVGRLWTAFEAAAVESMAFDESMEALMFGLE